MARATNRAKISFEDMQTSFLMDGTLTIGNRFRIVGIWSYTRCYVSVSYLCRFPVAGTGGIIGAAGAICCWMLSSRSLTW
jgi:hypothetical protein